MQNGEKIDLARRKTKGNRTSVGVTVFTFEKMREKLQKMSLLLINLKKGLPAAFNPLPCFSLPSSVLFLWIFFLVNKKICVNCYIPRPFEFFLLRWRKNCSGHSFATLPPFQFSIDYIIMNHDYIQENILLNRNLSASAVRYHLNDELRYL